MTLRDASIPRVTVEQFDELLAEVKVWGRWGEDDELGALNLITDAHRVRAVGLVTTGTVVSLARPVATAPGPNVGEPCSLEVFTDGANRELLTGASDRTTIAAHGMSNTHLDALCHVAWRHQMYNGVAVDAIRDTGVARNSIAALREGFVGRGVLLDIPRALGRPYLHLGEAIMVDDLELAETTQGVRVGEGDILLVRTGRGKREEMEGEVALWPDGQPGLHVSILPWLRDRGVSLLAGDGSSDLWPSPVAGVSSPLHVGTLVMLGIHLLDNAALEDLAEECERHGRHEFLFTMSAMVLDGATGALVNPLAML